MASKVEVVGDGFDCDEETTFLFTSESVGEGHPGDDCRPLRVGCGQFVTWSESSNRTLANSLPGIFAPWTFRL